GVTLKAYAHQDVPFERLVQELQPQRDLSRSPLFQTMLAFQDGPVEEPRLAGLAAEVLEPHTGTAKFELTLALSESGVFLEYNCDLFDAATARRLAGGLVTLLAGAAAAPELSLLDLPLLGEAEARQVLVEWNATASPYPAELGLHELFERQAARTPEAVALIHGLERLSYRDLDVQAERLAHRLRALGVGPEVRVAVLARRTPAMVAALLAVLKAGGAYVPLDPGYPAARVALVLADSAAPVLLTEEALASSLPPYAGEVVLLDGAPMETVKAEKEPRGFFHPEQLAYLIYTSGSTGRPKGVGIRHASAVAMVSWAAAAFPAGRLARVLASTSICFDLSVFELFVPLAAGGAVVLADDVLALPELAAADEVTLVNTVPSGLAELVRAGALPDSVRTVNLAGEPLRRELVSRLYESSGVQEVYNLYGPSEDTTYSTGVLVARSEEREPSIGRPLANARVYVLDVLGHGLRPVPPGAAGELWLGGEGLARGYLGRPDLTAERFRPDPFGGAGGRLYRTGDRARWLAAGELEFLGRLDHQVKVRGFRIEPGEIEAALARHPGVAEAAVVVREDRLVAYVAPGPDAAELRAFLRERLPEYMVPSSWVVLERLPRTPNGKVDRRALPALLERRVERRFTAPRTPVEELLAGIWSDLLRVERVGADDDFFDLGGHSLLATQVVSRLRGALGVELPLRSLFEAPTVAALAARVEAARRAESAAMPPVPPVPPVPRSGDLPISFSQERLWILDRFEPGSASYNIAGAVRLAGDLDVAALRQALAWLVRRHETLRTTFVPAGGGAAQRIAPELQVPMPLVDLRGLGGGERQAAIESWTQEVAATSFDLARGPLLRVVLLALEEREHALLLAVHHIVSDGWSMGVLIRELAAAYAALAAGREPSLPELNIQYADFAVWQRERLQGERLAGLVEHWRSHLAGAPPALELPTDRPRPAIRTFRGGHLGLELPAALSRELRGLSRRHGATLFMTLLAAFDVLLGRLAGQEDVVVGLPIAGRERPEVQGLIGMFLNTLVLRADLSGSPGFAALLATVRETALAAYAHQELPFEKLLDELRPERDLSRTPLFQVFFNMLNFPAARIELPGLTVEPLSSPEAPAKFDLTVYVSEPGEGIHCELVYNADLFDEARIAEMARQYEAVLAQAVADPEMPIDRLSLSATSALLPDPRAPLPDAWMGAVHERFAEWARRDPGRPAVMDDRESWSYGELDERADRLARRLRAAGVDKGDVVAIYGHRSARLVWAVLGVMKAGAAFTVLDPAHPPARLIDCLALAAPRGWIELAAAGPVPQALNDFLADSGCLISLTLPLPGEGEDAVESPRPSPPGRGEEGSGGGQVGGSLPSIGPDDIAYVAFTSGSTGIPKGILGRHGPLSHFIPWQQRRFGLGETDRFSMLSGLAHDPLQRDMFTPLQIGGTICVPDPADITVPGRLAAWMRRQEVTVAHLTPAMGQILTEIPPDMEPPRLDALRWAFLVGDVLTRRDVARLRELAPGLTCVNFYGSTETQRSVGYHEVGPGEAAPGWRGKESLPLGRGVEGVQLLVINRAGERAGVGELGEIYVRGHHLARGYLGDPEGTAAKFLDNPFGGRPGDRVYRTGDLGRYLPDGEVEFAGRADFQVKIRGFRIEPGEIEALLARNAAVRDCAVVARDAAGGEKRLVAYVVPERPGVTVAELRAYTKERLPDYMVPSAFVLMEKLPVTPNNKLDRRALPDPAEERAQDGSYVAPRNDAERKVAEVLREVLAIDKVGLHDNFFELGGSSLQLVRVHSKLREVFAREMQVFELFTHPTVATLAGFLSDGEAPVASSVAAREMDRTEELQVGKDRRRMRFEKMRQRA
ncbi:MAG TPA: amino acid adenylation domain-containing protein, partial [Thermoanaerobaculia bacterium]|nr:amino acid adenylation domain-containing protein [Thermoanaerobaculia bacterium]